MAVGAPVLLALGVAWPVLRPLGRVADLLSHPLVGRFARRAFARLAEWAGLLALEAWALVHVALGMVLLIALAWTRSPRRRGHAD
jgi:hypothetical protein